MPIGTSFVDEPASRSVDAPGEILQAVPGIRHETVEVVEDVPEVDGQLSWRDAVLCCRAPEAAEDGLGVDCSVVVGEICDLLDHRVAQIRCLLC